MLNLRSKYTVSNYTVKYDAWNRLTKINRGSQVLQINRYDGLHRRVSRESNTTGVRHFYWNEQWQCVEERVDASTTADRQYVWHPYYIDALAISYNSSGTAHYYVQDGNFNVTAAMDSSGAVVERYSYTPYGECIVLNADFTLDSSSGGDGLSDISNEYTYTGRRLDVETGLYQYRHRYYHAQLGRFVNRDPIRYADGWSLYRAYFALTNVDPFGLKCGESDPTEPNDDKGPCPNQKVDPEMVPTVELCKAMFKIAQVPIKNVPSLCDFCKKLPKDLQELCKKACKEAEKKGKIPSADDLITAACCSGIPDSPYEPCLLELIKKDIVPTAKSLQACEKCCNDKFEGQAEPRNNCWKACQGNAGGV